MVSRRRLDHFTLETLSLKAVFSIQVFLKKAGTRSMVILGNTYTSICRENKAGTVPSYSWVKSILYQGIEVGNKANISMVSLVMSPHGILPVLQMLVSQ